MSNQVDIAALRALLEKATPGEWTDAGNKIGADGHGIAEVEFDNEHDVPYVVALVNAAPALLDAYDELEKARADASGHLAMDHGILTCEECQRDYRVSVEPDHVCPWCERDRLRAEVERLRGRDATALLTGVRVISSAWIERGTIIVNDQDMTDAGFAAALTPPSKPEPIDPKRCEVCGWTLAESRDKGCVAGDCSYRPEQGSDEWYRIKARREALTPPTGEEAHVPRATPQAETDE